MKIKNIINNWVPIIEQQISILEWFLKDRVKLNIGVIMLETQVCIKGINYILQYFQIENSYFKCQ